MAVPATDVSGIYTLPSFFCHSDHTYERISVNGTVSSCDINNNIDETSANELTTDPHFGHVKDTDSEITGTTDRWSLQVRYANRSSTCLNEHSSGSTQENHSLHADTFEKGSGSGSAYFSLKDASSSSVSAHQTSSQIADETHTSCNDGEFKDNTKAHTQNTTRKTYFRDDDPSPEHAVDIDTDEQDSVILSNNALPKVTSDQSENGPRIRNALSKNEQNQCNQQLYFDVIRRCDRLINRLQLQNQENSELILTCNRYRKTVYVQTVLNVVLVFGGMLLVCTYLLSRHDSSMVQGALLQNVTKRVSSLQDNYVRVTDLVSDAMTRSKSFIHLNSDRQLEENGGIHTMQWDNQDITRKGTLELSKNKKNVVISTGAFYDIYINVHFSLSVNETREIRLAYDVVHRRGAKDLHVEHAFHRHTAVQGHIRQDLALQTTRYLVNGDGIAVIFGADHWANVAKYQGASSLALHELT